MSRGGNIPQIGKGPQQFSRASLPPIELPMRPPQQPETYDQIDDPLQDLAMEIYARVAVDHILYHHVDLDTLKSHAKSARLAAQAFFDSQESEHHG